MAFRKRSTRPAEEPHETIASVNCVHGWARLIRAARSIDFARRDASDPELWPLSAPYRPVAVVNGHRRASEGFTGWHDLGGRVGWRQEIPADNRDYKFRQEAHAALRQLSPMLPGTIGSLANGPVEVIRSPSAE